ncbi:hypothetical protein HMPREF9104_03232 [Lentilactobacillus kisonensis F0435]|uniref:Uncharacterized protein n=2 Tax=Lentilactobacillus kisonensis TaxID=481722 RepID=H1LKS8_9LACO|nr:hypothetical protein HMPREF9104_03232 [Lentilactobacillus kisonensis F0435]
MREGESIMVTTSSKRVDLQFGIECLVCIGLTILFHFLQVSYLSSSGLFIWTLVGGLTCWLIWLTNFWRARNTFRSVIKVSLKLVSYALYSLVLIMVVNALLAIVWQGTHFWAQGLLSLGTILIIGLSLPGFFKLVVNETNPILRMVSIFFYYLVILASGFSPKVWALVTTMLTTMAPHIGLHLSQRHFW